MTRPSRAKSLLVLAAVLSLTAAGCTPARYRTLADEETYQILRSKSGRIDPVLPVRDIDPAADSRNHDPGPADCPPMPPDDPVAHREMHHPGDQPGYRDWHARGDAPNIVHGSWEAYLERDPDGSAQLSAGRAVELGLVHSRDYQFELEELYLTALSLTFERFEFDLQWFGGNATDYTRFGRTANASRTLTSRSFLGFGRGFAAGGQWLANFANTLVWEFTGDGLVLAPSNLAVTFVQPLLRGAFRDVRLENLTQAERDVLYQVRRFARFRKQFYVDLIAGEQGYLGLLLQLQAIRNGEQNLEALEQNLRAHEALAEAGLVSPLQVDQVYQSTLAGRLGLIRATNSLENSLDAYKIRLGLPPELNVSLDDGPLSPFELNSEPLRRLESSLTEVSVKFRQLDSLPTADRLRAGYAELDAYLADAEGQVEAVSDEWRRWQSKPSSRQAGLAEAVEREQEARRSMRRRLTDIANDLADLHNEVTKAGGEFRAPVAVADAQTFQRLTRESVNGLADLLVVQTQIRAYLIELNEVPHAEGSAIETALRDRLDLMNRRAEVVDRWRQVRVAGNALGADLDIFLDADVATRRGVTDLGGGLPAGSNYRVGVRFDAPLNRLAERNNYRAELISYQRSRRNFIEGRDEIVQSVRRDMRVLDAERLNFEISRQSLIAASRQVELARLQLLAPDPGNDSSATQDALNAFNSLLDAKNSLIDSWVAYETARLQLMLDTESLRLDEQGQLQDDPSRVDRSGPPETPRPVSWESGDDTRFAPDLDYFGPDQRAEYPPPVHF